MSECVCNICPWTDRQLFHGKEANISTGLGYNDVWKAAKEILSSFPYFSLDSDLIHPDSFNNLPVFPKDGLY